MKIMYYKGNHPNFGDELNSWMWPRLLPDFFDNDEQVLFIGIGSTIGDHYDKAAQKIIFGTGFVPQYNAMPDVHRPDWRIYFVRGPRTTHFLKLSPDYALGDSAILLRTLIDFRQRSPEVVSFMPHWESLDGGNWEQVCRLAGINLIDPRWPVETVIRELLRSRLVITEAMHGAIVADAFRIPWIPLIPLDAMHREKWFDWAEALEITLKPYRLWPSSLSEAKKALIRHPKLARLIGAIASSPISAPAEQAAIHQVVHSLTRLAKVTPSLSEDNIIDRVTERMQEKLQQLHRDYHDSSNGISSLSPSRPQPISGY